MQNISLLFLSISSFFSVSPFYTINRNDYRRKSLISNSYFSHSFTNIVYSTAKRHSTKVDGNVFKFTLNTPLVFANEQKISGVCDYGSVCCVSTTYDFQPGKTIENVTVTKDSFPDKFGNRNTYFEINECGDIIITNCTFLQCYTNADHGGGIYVHELCQVILHKCIFDGCNSKKNGGAGAIAEEIVIIEHKDDKGNVVYEELAHKKAKRLDIQYTCFQNCYTRTDNQGYGVALLMGADNVKFFYASTVNCPSANQKLPKGAQFDIYADSVSSQYINTTNGKAMYCGAMEYRNANQGFFQFQTIIGLNCKYTISFTSVSIEGLEITSCNFVKNTINFPSTENADFSPPALVFVMDKNLVIENFYFIDNYYNDNGKFVGRENKEINVKITMINCYANNNDRNLWSGDFIETKDCNFDNMQVTTIELIQLNLGDCQGEATAGQMVITSFFTASSQFSPSSPYTKSQVFTKTAKFTSSGQFSQSSKFTESSPFTQSSTFTPSHHFNATDYFTPSDKFSPSSSFSSSSGFTETVEFSNSKDFSYSDSFSESAKFSRSNFFSDSEKFSHSNFFTKTAEFTESSLFSHSSFFTKSLPFTLSEILPLIVPGGNQGKTDKNTGLIIGAAVGSVAAAGAIAGIVAFFLIRKRRSLIQDGVDMMKETDSSITVDNELQNVMDKDDPFADDFGKEMDEIH